MDSLEKGKTYEFLHDGRVYIYTWDKFDQLTAVWQSVPAGSQFVVLESPWTPPSNTEPEVRIATAVPLPWQLGEVKRELSVGVALLTTGIVQEVRPTEQAGVVHTEEGATYTPWTDGYAVGFHVTAPGKPDRWLLLNPSQTDSLGESNAFVYLEADEPTPTGGHEQPVCYVTIWEDDAEVTPVTRFALMVNGYPTPLPCIPDPLADEVYTHCLAVSTYTGNSCTLRAEHWNKQHMAAQNGRITEIWD